MVKETSSCSAALLVTVMPCRDQQSHTHLACQECDHKSLAMHVQPLETRAAGASLNTASNMLFTFLIGQVFISMLCSMKWGVFLLFTGMAPAPAHFQGLGDNKAELH